MGRWTNESRSIRSLLNRSQNLLPFCSSLAVPPQQKQSQELEPSQDGWWITGAKRRERCQDVWTREQAVWRPGRLEVHVNHFRSRRPGSAGVCPTKDHWLWLWASFPETAGHHKTLQSAGERGCSNTAEEWNSNNFSLPNMNTNVIFKLNN